MEKEKKERKKKEKNKQRSIKGNAALNGMRCCVIMGGFMILYREGGTAPKKYPTSMQQ